MKYILIITAFFITDITKCQIVVDSLNLSICDDGIWAIVSYDYYKNVMSDTSKSSSELFADFSYYIKKYNKTKNKVKTILFFTTNNIFINGENVLVKDVKYIFIQNKKKYEKRIIYSKNAIDFYLNIK